MMDAYNSYLPALVNWLAHKHSLGRKVAESIAGEALAVIAEEIIQGKRDETEVEKAHLYKVADAIAIAHFSSGRLTHNPATRALIDALKADIDESISIVQWLILVMYLLKGFSLEKIAEELDLPYVEVESLFYEALETLRGGFNR